MSAGQGVLHDAGVISAHDTAVVIDSTADLPDYADRFANLRMVPLTVRFGDEPDLRDHVDLDADAFYTRLALSSEPPRTSAPAPQAFADCYQQLLDGPYRHVVSVHISGKLSATVQSARLAAETHRRSGDRDRRAARPRPGPRSARSASRRCSRRARRSRRSSRTASGSRVRAHCLFSVETLDYLQRGGRVGRAQALVGGLLGVRPILGLVDGEVVAVARVRGAARVLSAMLDQFESDSADDVPAARRDRARAGARAGRGARERGTRLRPLARSSCWCRSGPVIGTYGGPGTIGLLWVAEPGSA